MVHYISVLAVAAAAFLAANAQYGQPQQDSPAYSPPQSPIVPVYFPHHHHHHRSSSSESRRWSRSSSSDSSSDSRSRSSSSSSSESDSDSDSWSSSSGSSSQSDSDVSSVSSSGSSSWESDSRSNEQKSQKNCQGCKAINTPFGGGPFFKPDISYYTVNGCKRAVITCSGLNSSLKSTSSILNAGGGLQRFALCQGGNQWSATNATGFRVTFDTLFCE